MSEGKNSWTYARSGVDIEAGNALVRRISAHAKATKRVVKLAEPKAPPAATTGVPESEAQKKE